MTDKDITNELLRFLSWCKERKCRLTSQDPKDEYETMFGMFDECGKNIPDELGIVRKYVKGRNFR